MHNLMCVCIVYLCVAPVCFNTTYCGGKTIGNNFLTIHQCCVELSGVSFVSSEQCVLCPKGMYVLLIMYYITFLVLSCDLILITNS